MAVMVRCNASARSMYDKRHPHQLSDKRSPISFPSVPLHREFHDHYDSPFRCIADLSQEVAIQMCGSNRSTEALLID